eukprot:7159799-Prymnesium_polylepis.1
MSELSPYVSYRTMAASAASMSGCRDPPGAQTESLRDARCQNGRAVRVAAEVYGDAQCKAALARV